MPSALNAQAWTPPALTVANFPSGGEDWPYKSQPQQSTAPFVLNPQVWLLPALTEVNFPSGGVDAP